MLAGSSITHQNVQSGFSFYYLSCQLSNWLKWFQIHLNTWTRRLYYSFILVRLILPIIRGLSVNSFNCSTASVRLVISAIMTRHPLEARPKATWKPMPEKCSYRKWESMSKRFKTWCSSSNQSSFSYQRYFTSAPET